MGCRRRSSAIPKSSEPILANSSTSKNSLAISGLNAGYASVRVLEDISLSVSHAETVVLLGTNGNGKSTLMKCVMGMLRPTAGTIRAEIDGAIYDLVGRSTEEIVDLGITLVPEGRRLFPKLTVEENLLLGAFRPTARSLIERNLDSSYETFPRLRERLRIGRSQNVVRKEAKARRGGSTWRGRPRESMKFSEMTSNQSTGGKCSSR